MSEHPERKPTLRESASRLLDLPAAGTAGVPRLELTGDRELYLEGYLSILAYSREEIHVDGGRWVLRVMGRSLEIRAMREGELRITGQLHRLELV